jgi:hypothetical protein
MHLGIQHLLFIEFNIDYYRLKNKKCLMAKNKH